MPKHRSQEESIMIGNGSSDLSLIRKWARNIKACSPESSYLSETKAALEPIAITGVGGFFPGCMNVAALWDHIDGDSKLITPIELSRFQLGAFSQAESVKISNSLRRWGGFIPDIASFDPELFNILPLEAEEMDPRQRLLLMSTWRTLEDAGLDHKLLAKSNTGVFVACEANEYAVLMGRSGYTPKLGFAQSNSMVANRISYAFDFSGPSEMVDATCAGFAVALNRAVVALRAGLIDRAIVGAANLMLLPDPFLFLGDAGQLTSNNTVNSFGRNGDGFIRAEGVGTILIERFGDAIAAGRTIYANIRHTAVNFNGQGGLSMASPNTEAHKAVIKTCYRDAGIDPRQITYIEAQGMGSPVADIAEWSAMNRALAELCDEKGLKYQPGFCRVSSLKPMLGHMHSASSLGALLKVIRSIQTRRVHKLLGFSEPNEHCDMLESPCRIIVETEDWESAGSPRLAAIHAYGSGGNNAHILVEETRSNVRPLAHDNTPSFGHVFNLKRYWFSTTALRPTECNNRPHHSVLETIWNILGLDENRFNSDISFSEIGLDSLSIAPFITRLENACKVSLRKSDIFSYSTPIQLAAYVESLLQNLNSNKTAVQNQENVETYSNAIAIVGMSLEVGGADNLDEFWQLLREGRSGITSIPSERTNSNWSDIKNLKGGFISEVDTFDPLFFRISPKESNSMDPRHRKLLQAAWAAIEDSGHSPDEWRGAENGVFIGIEESDYPYNEHSPITSVHSGTAPARIGYFLDIKGPVLAISTACSSSLVAVHYACRSIINGECDSALAGGCNIISQPEFSFQALAKMGNMLSPDSTCYPFDHRANGMVLGEGVGVVVLKRLSKAIHDGDSIYAVIKGSGINYDGRTNGLTAPSGARQRELYENVYRQCGIKPHQISHIVAHGTGTVLGDPVECNALIDVYACDRQPKPWCAITSPKANVGHSQAASGIVNLITATLSLHHCEIPPAINFEIINNDIPLEGSPFYMNMAVQAWRGQGRHAAVSSFGHTGTNAHLVLEEFSESMVGGTDIGECRPVIIILSAKSERQLRQMAKSLMGCLRANLGDLAYTLQVGRVEMEERLGIIAHSIDDLRAKLQGFLLGSNRLKDVFFGSSKPTSELSGKFGPDCRWKTREEWSSKASPAELLEYWVIGFEVDWKRFHGHEKHRRLHLPTYPFEKGHYWLNAGTKQIATKSTIETNHHVGPVFMEPSGDGTEVMVFKEEWVEFSEDTGSGSSFRTIVVVLPGRAMEGEWFEEIRRVEPQAQYIAVQADAESIEAEIHRVRSKILELDVLIYLGAFQDHSAIRDASMPLPLFHAMAATQLLPRHLVILCPFRNQLDFCFADAWTAYGRSLKGILPTTKTTVIALDISTINEGNIAKYAAEVGLAECKKIGENAVLYSRGQRQVVRIQPAVLEPVSIPLKVGGTYLITGGCSGLGFICAKHLAEVYSAKLILIGRSVLDLEKERRIEFLKTLGSQVIYLRADVGNRDSMESAVTTARQALGPIHGVIHSAGVAGTNTVLKKGALEFQSVTHPKISGTIILDEILSNENLDFVAYFSSCAAQLGDFGSCDYSIANRFQTAYARYRNILRDRGQRMGHTIAINWAVWRQGRMGESQSHQTQFYLQTTGQRALESNEALTVFKQLLGQNNPQHIVLAGKPERLKKLFDSAINKNTKSQKQDCGFLAPENTLISIEEQLQYDLVQIVSALIGLDPRKVRQHDSLGDYGFDSISLGQLADKLSNYFGIKVTPALFFECSTLKLLAQHYLTQHCTAIQQFYLKTPDLVLGKCKSEQILNPIPSNQVNADDLKLAVHSNLNEPIAIIGMSGRFPQARTIDEMWQILAEAQDAVRKVPPERYDWSNINGNPLLNKIGPSDTWMGCMPGVDEFDPLFFEISPSEAELMDPRQRHLLQESWNALEDAGYGPNQIANHRVGVFVGVEEGDYALVTSGGDLTGNHSAILASRLAYFLDFRGPVMAINTACSSGLVAAHQACLSLRNGECDSALVAGVSLQLTPFGHIAMKQAGMLSPDGKCSAFDKKANGMVPGEAAVVLLLKRFSQAQMDGDVIHGIIRASGVNYDGKTNGITAPSGVAQYELLADIYNKSGIDPSTIEYIVAHGTGTKIGDPVEVNALNRAFRETTKQRGTCALTSTKSNFGHTFAASGLVGAVCLIQSFQHELIPASLHCNEESDYIDWNESPFFVNKVTKPWPTRVGKKRSGAVSSFGMSGTNAHMVFEEYAIPNQTHVVSAPFYLLLLSAKTIEALNKRIDMMVHWFRKSDNREKSLVRVSFTLLECRHHFSFRVAVVVRNIEEAIQSLEKIRVEKTGPNLWYSNTSSVLSTKKQLQKYGETLLRQAQENLDDPDKYQEILNSLAELYCQGYEFCWQPLFGEKALPRVRLPGYPFARETYWANSSAHKQNLDQRPTQHPLVHENISDFSNQQFQSIYSGREDFLLDHRVQGEVIMPGVAYLEIARAALEMSTPVQRRTASISLSNIVWLAPFILNETSETLFTRLIEDRGQIEFEILTNTKGIHSRGKIEYVQTDARGNLDLLVLRDRMNLGKINGDQCYSAFRESGLEYGSSYQGINEILLGTNEVLAHIELKGSKHDLCKTLILNPGLMDSIFQATLGIEIYNKNDSEPRIPFALKQFRLLENLPDRLWVWARRAQADGSAADVSHYDLDIADENGRIVGEIRGFTTRGGLELQSKQKVVEYPRILRGDEFYIADHGSLLPGVVSLEWARAAGRLKIGRPIRGIKNVIWKRPLSIEEKTLEIGIRLKPSKTNFTFDLFQSDQIYAQGTITTEEPPADSIQSISIEDIEARCSSSVLPAEIDALTGSRLGARMKSLAALKYNPSEAIAFLKLPSELRDTAEEFILHPSLMNGALQACTILSRIADSESGFTTPFSLQELWIHGGIPTEACVYIRRNTEVPETFKNPRVNNYDLLVTDLSGKIIVSIKGYSAVVSNVDIILQNTLFAAPVWEQADPVINTSCMPTRPVFVLTKAMIRFRELLAMRWPESRIVELSQEQTGQIQNNENSILKVFELIQWILKGEEVGSRPLILLASEIDDGCFASACAALFRTVALEKSRMVAKVVRFSNPTNLSVEMLIAYLENGINLSTTDCDFIFRENGTKEVRKIREINLNVSSKSQLNQRRLVIWITGGFGGIGRTFATYYALHLQSTVFLTGRSAPNEDIKTLLKSLQLQGSNVYYLQGDITQYDDAKKNVKTILETAGHLDGVIHSAGLIDDGHILDKNPEVVARVWRPKVSGAIIVDEVTKTLPLQFMAFFSSLSGTFGNVGQSDYAAANAFLDGFAEERNVLVKSGERHGHTLSVAWPLWRDGGMKMDQQSVELLKHRSGMTPMESPVGIAALGCALRSGLSHVLVLHGDRDVILNKIFLGNSHSNNGFNVSNGKNEKLDVDGYLYNKIKLIVADQQKISPEKIDSDVELPQYGYDSIRLTELANRLNKVFSLDLMPTLFFERTTLRSIANYLAEKYPSTALAHKKNLTLGSESLPFSNGFRNKSTEIASARSSVNQEVAIIGISGRFPGSSNLDEFWDHLVANDDLITEVPLSRWNWRDHFGDPIEVPGKTKVKNAGFVDGIDLFDAAFFGISPREAISMDPQLRILLETVWAAIENAGYRANDLSGTKTGVFVGVSTSDYKDSWLRLDGTKSPKDGPALVSHFTLANRISYALNLVGPSEPIDTACSASLIAIHRAIEAIRLGNCEQAIVGGVNVICHPAITIGASRAGMLSEDGRCKTFDKSADGYGRGEGVGAIILKPLEAALRDGDHVYAIVRGTSENHGGRAQSPTAPNPMAQRDLLIAAYSRAEVDPRTISYIEAHGTGTTLGDPIEIDGLRSAFEALYQKLGRGVAGPHCGLGSVKANIGHLEAAAGIAGVLKVVLMLQHAKIPGNPHLLHPNPYLRLDGTPFYLVRETTEWQPLVDDQKRVVPRRAGVSSFGIGGSNAHVILEEYAPQGSQNIVVSGAQIIVLSAKTNEQLNDIARNLKKYLQTIGSGDSPELSDIAYTLQMGREAWEERLGFIATSKNELTKKLEKFLAGDEFKSGFHRGRKPRLNDKLTTAQNNEDPRVGEWMRCGMLEHLVELWVRGADLDWSPIWQNAKPRRVALPSYPFARNRFWFGEQQPHDERVEDIEQKGIISTVVNTPFSISIESVVSELIGSLSKILFLKENEIDQNQSFVELGLDSVLAVEWVQSIKKRYGVKLPATKVYDYPNVLALSAYLEKILKSQGHVGEPRTQDATLTLENILDQVLKKEMSAEDAERMMIKMGLNLAMEDKASL